MSERRSGAAGIAQGELFGEGVGARQEGAPLPPMGGEYLENSTPTNFSKTAPAEKKRRDPRFDELERIGLPAAWLRVAERIGFDAWLEVWRMLSEDERIRHDGGARMPKLRCYSAYVRYQRNRYIVSLAQHGIPIRMIQEFVWNGFRERLDFTHVGKIAKRATVRK